MPDTKPGFGLRLFQRSGLRTLSAADLRELRSEIPNSFRFCRVRCHRQTDRSPDTTSLAAIQPAPRSLAAGREAGTLSYFQHRATRAAFVFVASALVSERGSRFAAMPARGVTLACGAWSGCMRPAPLSPVSGQSRDQAGRPAYFPFEVDVLLPGSAQ